jgi:hypothetical protein
MHGSEQTMSQLTGFDLSNLWAVTVVTPLVYLVHATHITAKVRAQAKQPS